MTKTSAAPSLEAIRDAWLANWPEAVDSWSHFIQLHEPVWCFSAEEEQRESLAGSFAMIRLIDHTIVISIRQVQEAGLSRFAREILAHEIGHHVYCPADLTDNARLLARIRRGLPTKELFAPMVANLYADLLINDRLQRSVSIDMAGVYLQLGVQCQGRLWTLYMRSYEILWNLPRGSLAKGAIDERLNQDAQLAARLIRSYSKEWLDGAGRFAALYLPYIIDDDPELTRKTLATWCDTRDAGRGGLPDGLAEIDDAELSGAIHPAEDPELSGFDGLLDNQNQEDHARQAQGKVPGKLSGHKSAKNYRHPFEYSEVLQATGVDLDARALTARYYRELAIPHLMPFPTRKLPGAVDPIPEGLDVWDVSSPIDRIDWFGTLLASSRVIPGVTTRERLLADGPGREPNLTAYDLYLGVDCSGSMGDPAYHLSYPVLAGAIIALSALRAGSCVKVVLSGEPGKTISTDGFVRDQAAILKTLTHYLGTGYSFGIHRLAETFGEQSTRGVRPVHILIVSDNDMFSMLDQKGNGRAGWDIAGESLARCGGGGTFVLQLQDYVFKANRPQKLDHYLERMRDQGWNVSPVNSMDQLVVFARQFSRSKYGELAGRSR